MVDNHLNMDPNPHLYVFFTYQNDEPGTAGIAWVGTVCQARLTEVGYIGIKEDRRSSINEYFVDDINTAEVCYT